MNDRDLGTTSSSPATLTVSDRAAKRIAELLAKPEYAGLTLRLAVQGGGCSGFAYGFSFDDEVRDDDIVIEKDDIRVIVDDVSLDYLRGSEIDYVDEMIGATFTVRNPNASSSCGCGNSFSMG
ncbi:MAG: iron-sulfur cluster insertion protein ErpA [Alphaproteobacteria bacterium]|nr:iron-sulfur cluster insertion protein ErpA [Alphaproteobacteria bacterium]